MSLSLDALNHDILIYIFTVLSIPEILLLRQASRRLYLVSEEHAVWKSACTNDILRNGIPFQNRPLTSFSAKDLQRQTLRAYKLGLNWKSATTSLDHVASSSPGKGGVVEGIRFLACRGRNWIVTTAVGIWWTLCIRDCDSLEVVAEWSPGKALLNGLAVNADEHADAAIAVSVHNDGHTTVEILAIFGDDASSIAIQPLRTLDTSSKPIALNGDLVALCDHHSETLILNWKTQAQALLKSPETWQDKPLHVVFTHGSIFVARARSICIFEEPRMVLPGDDLDVVLPRVFKSFGWVDGVSLALGPFTPLCPAISPQSPLSMLVRTKADDPWIPAEQFQFMTLNTERHDALPQDSHGNTFVEHDPHSFPFDLIYSHSSYHRGPLRCSDMVLGSHGSAVWVQPSDWAAVGMITDDTFVEQMSVMVSPETLVVALFPGLLNPGSSEAHTKVTLPNRGNGWSCLDYDETQGLIAVGTRTGEVMLYRL